MIEAQLRQQVIRYVLTRAAQASSAAAYGDTVKSAPAEGINAGRPFIPTISESGPTLLLISMPVVLTTVLVVLLAGYFLLKIKYDDLLGIASGAPAIRRSWSMRRRMAPTDHTDIGYAMIFPSITIAKVIAVQITGHFASPG